MRNVLLGLVALLFLAGCAAYTPDPECPNLLPEWEGDPRTENCIPNYWGNSGDGGDLGGDSEAEGEGEGEAEE